MARASLIFPDEGRSVLEEPNWDDTLGKANSEADRNRDLYAYASEAQREWADTASRNQKYNGGAHWTSEQRAVLAERGQTPVAVQLTFQFTEQAVDMLTANRPSYRASAREDSDVATNAVWSDIFQWTWDQSRGSNRIRSVVRDNFVQGRGVTYVYHDPDADFGKGEVKFIDLEPKEVFPDPAATDPLYDDAAFVLLRRLYTWQQASERWPDSAEEFKSGPGRTNAMNLPWGDDLERHNNEIIDQRNVNEPHSRDRYEVIERFEKVRTKWFRFHNPADQREEVLSEADYEQRREESAHIITEGGVRAIVTERHAVAELDEVFNFYGAISHLMPGQQQVGQDGQVQEGEPVRMAGPAHEGSIPESETIIEPTTIGQLIDDGQELIVSRFEMDRIRVTASCGHTLLYEPAILPTSHYPIIAFPASSSRNPYPTADLTRIKDLQDIVNKSLSLILAHAANSTNIKVFYPDGSIQDMDQFEQMWAKAGSAMIPYDPGFGAGGGSPGGIVVAAPPPLPNALYENLDRARELMQSILGIFATQQGDPSAQAQTYRGTLAVDEMGQRRIKGKMDQIYVSLRRQGEVIRDYCQALYSEEKVFRLFSPSGDQRKASVNQIVWDDVTQAAHTINDITVGHYDIMVLPGSTLPNNRWAKLELDLQMYDRGLVDDIAVLKHSEYPDASEILERKSIYSQLQGQIGQITEELKKVTGDLQTAERKAVNADQRVIVEKAKSRLDQLLHKVEADATVFKDRMQSTAARAEKLLAEGQANRKNQDQ